MVDYFIADESSAAELRAERDVYVPLTEDVRALVEATVLTMAEEPTVRRARQLIAEAAGMLREASADRPYGIRFNLATGEAHAYGNAVIGVRNPVAPPLDILIDSAGVSAQVHLGPQYEGPTGRVHGGVSALLLDQLLGEAVAVAGRPGMTGTLTLRYRKPALLGPLSLRGWLNRTEGPKSIARGELHDREGLCVEAEGVFVMPRAAREHQATLREGSPVVVRFE